MNNVINYPKSIDERLNQAIRLFQSKRYTDALELFKKLVDDGCDYAFVYIGGIYELPKSGYQDLEKAYFYYYEAIKRRGTVDAYLGLVRIHLYGNRSLRNYDKAIEYCEFLINECQDPYAYFYLGHIYAEGLGVDANLEKAIQNFKKSWERGYVFGLTFIGLIESKRGRYIRGWCYRLRAAWHGLRIDDWRTAIPTHWTLLNYKDRFQY